jgi:hypothetical protein
MIVGSCVSGRQLLCEYGTKSDYPLWPTFNYCNVSSVDLSEHYKSVEHSFSGTAAQKSAATTVHFERLSQIDFLPTQMLNYFPQLNGLQIWRCDTFTTIRDNFFTSEFNAIQYLGLSINRIATIEANAFQHLPKLKWIALGSNQLRSLPHQLFKNNPELIAIWLIGNKISSITPDFFRNLNKLLRITLYKNRCIDRDFGCLSGSCSVSHSELDSALSPCYSNCLKVECAAKSGNLDNLSSEQIEKNLDLIIASGHKQKLIEKGYGHLIAEKDPTPKPKPEVVQEETEIIKNKTLECDAKKFEEISRDLKDLKVQHETLGNNLTLLIQAHDSEMKRVTQELADLKVTLKEIKNCSNDKENLKMELGELFKKEFKEFVKELNDGA